LGVLRGSGVVLWCAGLAFAPEAVAAAPAVDEVAAPAEGPAEGPAPAADVPVVSVTRTRPAAVEVVAAKKVRHDWYAGFGLGLGGGNLRGTESGARASVSVTGLARVGGRLTDKIGLGGMVSTSFGGTAKEVSGFSNLLAEALFFPVKNRGLGLSLGLGISSAWLRAQGADGMLVDRSTRVGGGFGVGLGYDFWVARRFNIGLWLRGDGSGGRYGLRMAGTFGLNFAWY
jgi:hypothetical protein